MLYNQLSTQEQNKLIHDIADYRNTVLPRLISCGRTVPRSEIPELLRGVDYLSYWPQYAAFIAKAHAAVCNFDQIVNSLAYLFGIVVSELSAEMCVNTPDGRQVIVLSQSQSLRRGRPTVAESEQRRRDEEAAARAQALAHLTGNVISTSDPAPIDTSRPTDTSRRKRDDEPDLFSSAVSAAIEQPTPAEQSSQPGPPGTTGTPENTAQPAQPGTPADLDPSSNLPRLRDLKWAMPESLALSVSELRDLYAVRANESNTAKMLLEQGAEISAMAEHTHAAKEAERKITHILRSVDEHLAWLYVMLTEVNPDWKQLVARREKQTGIPSEQLVTILAPYAIRQSGVSGGTAISSTEWFASTLQSCRKANDAAIAAATRDPEKEKEMHKMDAYIRRKDVNASPKRLATMQQYRAKLAEMGADADSLAAYDVFINAVAAILSHKAETPQS